ncbi:MAG TPA: hypothetical protein V6C97_01105 [Oculatellaceae cyanobacterium]
MYITILPTPFFPASCLTVSIILCVSLACSSQCVSVPHSVPCVTVFVCVCVCL